MGLDACVYCDCYEKGRLRLPPPNGAALCVEPDGSLCREHDNGELEDDLAFDRWREQLACNHPGGVILHHRIGNVSLIGSLRLELEREPLRFPILLTKVLYSGSHSGDYLPFNLIPTLQKELEALSDFRCTSPASDQFMAEFRTQMLELVAASLSVTKPIAF